MGRVPAPCLEQGAELPAAPAARSREEGLRGSALTGGNSACEASCQHLLEVTHPAQLQKY